MATEQCQFCGKRIPDAPSMIVANKACCSKPGCLVKAKQLSDSLAPVAAQRAAEEKAKRDAEMENLR